MTIESLTIITNLMNMSFHPSVNEDVMQQITLLRDGHGEFKRFILDKKVVLKSTETFICNPLEFFKIFENNRLNTLPLTASYNAYWEIIINSDEGYIWYQGLLSQGLTINGISLTQKLQDLVQKEGVIAFG